MTPLTDETGPTISGAAVASFEIAIANEQSACTIDSDELTEIARSVLRDEGVDGAQISIALVDDAAIHEVNRRFLGHDFPTDVISFPLQEPAALDLPSRSGTGEPVRSLDGEIVISAQTALRSAGEVGCTPAEELTLYLVHGLLHLCGYDDQSAADRRRMRQREKSHLQKFGIIPHYKD